MSHPDSVRHKAVAAVLRGEDPREVARILDVHPSSVCRWVAAEVRGTGRKRRRL